MLANCHQGVLCAPTLKIRINDADAEDDDDFADDYYEMGGGGGYPHFLIFAHRKVKLILLKVMVSMIGVLQNKRKMIMIMMLSIMMIRLCQFSRSHIVGSE